MVANGDSRVKVPTRGSGVGVGEGLGTPKGSDSCVNRRGGGANPAWVE